MQIDVEAAARAAPAGIFAETIEADFAEWHFRRAPAAAILAAIAAVLLASCLAVMMGLT
jgi:hypothetical protein